jgi:hypothetical protein
MSTNWDAMEQTDSLQRAKATMNHPEFAPPALSTLVLGTAAELVGLLEGVGLRLLTLADVPNPLAVAEKKGQSAFTSVATGRKNGKRPRPLRSGTGRR